MSRLYYKKEAWHNKPEVVYGYRDTLMAFTICKVMLGIMVAAVLGLLLLITVKDHDKQMLEIELAKVQKELKEEKLANFDKFKTIQKLENKIEELQAINNTSEDIVNYIKTYYKKVPSTVAKEIAKVTVEKATQHNVPVVAVIAIEEVESAFNPYAVSKKGARGVMQVMPKVWSKKLNLDSKFQLHDIETGIDAGCRILRQYLDDTNNNMKKALYKYVGGSNEYGKKVYEAMGKFIVFRSFSQMTVDDSNGHLIAEPIDVSVITDPITGDTIPLVPKKDVPQIKTPFSDVKIASPVLQYTEKQPFIHTIKFKGETLGLISQWYTGSVSNWQKIVEVNPELVPEKLGIGQKIMIPKHLLKNKTRLTEEFINGNE